MHAEQRITVFNFFVATAGLLVSGIGYTLRAPREMWPLGTAAGLLLLVFAVVFRKLDDRVSAIIKSSEAVMLEAEALVIETPALRAVTREREMTARARRGILGAWTYGRSFRFIFGLMACVGLASAALSLSRAPFPKITITWPSVNT